MQIDDYTDAINAVRPLDKRWEAFGWATCASTGTTTLGSRSRADPCPYHQEAPHRHHHGHGQGQRAFGRGRQLSSHNMPLSPEDVAAALQEPGQGTRNAVMLESQEMRSLLRYDDRACQEDPRIVDVEADLTGAHGMKPSGRLSRPLLQHGHRRGQYGRRGRRAVRLRQDPCVHSFAVRFPPLLRPDRHLGMLRRAERQNRRLRSGGVGAELAAVRTWRLEDMGIMRTLPGMTVFEPTDSVQFRKASPARHRRA